MKSRIVLFTAWLLVFSLLFCGNVFATPINIVGPVGSEFFGHSVTALPNGNFVVTDPLYDAPGPIMDVGAVYLYDGRTFELLSTTTGSTANDHVGKDGVKVLGDGNFVVISSDWTNNAAANAGAVTWCHQMAGCNGPAVTSGNSLVGFTPGDRVGLGFIQVGVTVLNNGAYVVASPFWDNQASQTMDVGAVTYGFQNGRAGVVTQDNSLTGTTTNDHVGGVVTVLTNGNYVVGSPEWDDPMFLTTDAGAVTWHSGTTDTFGFPVSASNSLAGRSANDQVGSSGIIPLTNGNYVISSPLWDNRVTTITNVGATTWAGGTGPTAGYVSDTNSLIGTTVDDSVSGSDVGFNGVVALSNGNYVVGSPLWDNTLASTANAGAVTWCNGTGPTVTTVATGNSLIGGTANDRVGGSVESFTGLTALTNGNYVVSSPVWNNPTPSTADVGAVTWCNGASGRIGTVSSANSLTGGTEGDRVGSLFSFDNYRAVTPLTNGNFVVISSSWNNPSPVTSIAGAVTWCNGLGGTTGLVTSSNSIIGTTTGDILGAFITPLNNGNYVASLSMWDNPAPAKADVGAVRWGNGLGGTVGTVSSGNSLVGGSAGDSVGVKVVALSNGNYSVRSYFWDNPSPATANAGAITWCDGTSGRTGLITAANSLIGGSAEDYVGSLNASTFAKGRYIVSSNGWNNPIGPIMGAGAITVLSGHGGPTGLITSINSVLGTVPTTGASLPYSYDARRSRLYVGRPSSNTVTTRTFRNTFDFDGDGNDDVSVFRPSTGFWHVMQSAAGYLPTQFGTNGDLITPGDFDGDGRTDIAVFRPSTGFWYILNSLDGSFRFTQFGQNGDIPATGDYDGDGRADTAVYRPSTGTFYVMWSSDNSFHFQQWGQNGDRPVMGDFDIDGKTDFAIFRPSIGTFYILQSVNQLIVARQFGQNGDKPIAGDFDGDGVTDIAVYRPGNGGWFYLRSSDNIFRGIGWGTTGDQPAAGDYDGDGKWDVAVFRPSTGVNYILLSTTGGFRAEPFGTSGDVPIGSAYAQ